MIAVCVFAAEVLRATLPAQQFDLVWRHSVQKTEWRETYRVTADGLQLIAAHVQGSGAGMEPGPNARRDDNGWTWAPQVPLLPELTLSSSRFGGDYQVCTAAHCTPWRELIGDDPGPVTLRPCAT